jgi:ankyrin repeat protein
VVAVSAVPLPNDSSVEQLQDQAKLLRDLARSGAQGALDLVAAHHPDGAHPVSLAGARLVVARHYGFASWARLKRHLETRDRYRRFPDEVGEVSDPADAFLVLACLRYGEDDSASRWERAARTLADHPEIRSNVFVAAACSDSSTVAAVLGDDPAAAGRDGGPFGWDPLLYLAYARHDPAVLEEATLATAQLLLDNGADPNTGYLWHGMCPPFTVLTGALGSGEGDQPEHPNGFALARLLLNRGADANDGQALYNRQFRADDRHLVLLLEHGLGRGDGGPWRARLGHTLDSPAQLVSTQLWWAIVHDLRDRVRLLVEDGADIHSRYSAPGGRPTWARTSDGRTPAEVAALAGSPEVVDYLVAHGATPPRLVGPEGLISAVLCGDHQGVEKLKDNAAKARRQRPGLIVWAAARRKLDAVRTLVELGFDVNAFGRSDVPMEQAWETALHHAAGNGDVELVRALLDLGADPKLRDGRFNSTPLGWAEHFDQKAAVELLERLDLQP